MAVTADAVLYPINQSNVTSKISAPVKRVLVNRGDHVRAGQLLAELESGDLAAALNESQHQYEQAQAAYQTTTGATVPEDRTKAQADVQSAQQAFDAAKTAYETANPGTTLKVTTDSSSALETKIEQGAPADVFLSADVTNPADNPHKITVKGDDGQTYVDGQDTLPGYDDEECTYIPGAWFDCDNSKPQKRHYATRNTNQVYDLPKLTRC